MQFNSSTTAQDLYSDARFLCGLDEGSDTTTYPINPFTRNCNLALDRCNSLILKANGWSTPFDDSNQSGELLNVSNNLVSGTQKLALDVTWLIITKVRIKDSAGNWITLPPLPRKEQTDAQLTSPSGTPASYFLMGNYLYFDKAPNYASSGGIEIQFQRGASYFVVGDTTKTPGFATQFHRLISLHAAADFCDTYEMVGRAASLRARIGSPPDLMNNQPGSGMEKELMDFYSRKDHDAKVTLTPHREDYGQMGLNPGNGFGSWNNPRGF